MRDMHYVEYTFCFKAESNESYDEPFWIRPWQKQNLEHSEYLRF